MILNDLKEWVETQVDQVRPDQSVQYLDYRGIPHVTFTSGGVKEQGEALPILCSTPEKAIECFKWEFLQYFDKVEGLKILHWRMFPALETETFKLCPQWPDIITVYYVVARFSIAGY